MHFDTLTGVRGAACAASRAASSSIKPDGATSIQRSYQRTCTVRVRTRTRSCHVSCRLSTCQCPAGSANEVCCQTCAARAWRTPGACMHPMWYRYRCHACSLHAATTSHAGLSTEVASQPPREQRCTLLGWAVRLHRMHAASQGAHTHTHTQRKREVRVQGAVAGGSAHGLAGYGHGSFRRAEDRTWGHETKGMVPAHDGPSLNAMPQALLHRLAGRALSCRLQHPVASTALPRTVVMTITMKGRGFDPWNRLT